MRVDALALPLLLLSPFAAAGSSNHKSNNRRAHKRLAKTSPEQERDLEIRDANQHNATLAKRQSFNGRGTFYYTGLGACGKLGRCSPCSKVQADKQVNTQRTRTIWLP